MLWMVLIGSISEAIAMLGMIIQESFDDFYNNLSNNKKSIRKHLKVLIICTIIVIVTGFALKNIYSFSYAEVSKTGEYDLLSFTSTGQISVQGQFYVHMNIDTNIYKFFYLDNDHIIKVESDCVKIEGHKGHNNAYVEEYTIATNNEWKNLYFLTFDLDNEPQKSYMIYNVSDEKIAKIF